MFEILARYWWVLLIRGLAAIAFGVLAFVWPGLTLATLILLFGAFALVDGVFALITAIAGRRQDENWWLGILRGVIGIGIGVVTFVNPAITALALVLYIAAWALASGVLEIAAAIRLRKEIEGEWALALAGVLSILFAGLLFWAPGAGALALLWWIAAWALVLGVLLVLESFKLRGLRERPGAGRRTASVHP
ncbi:MAG TPA: HdeD family acid-resistance protein [Myxococcota bacterium]|nr:HdeD family acid-resistance protein [Myxococcota bacterium]